VRGRSGRGGGKGLRREGLRRGVLGFVPRPAGLGFVSRGRAVGFVRCRDGGWSRADGRWPRIDGRGPGRAAFRDGGGARRPPGPVRGVRARFDLNSLQVRVLGRNRVGFVPAPGEALAGVLEASEVGEGAVEGAAEASGVAGGGGEQGEVGAVGGGPAEGVEAVGPLQEDRGADGRRDGGALGVVGRAEVGGPGAEPSAITGTLGAGHGDAGGVQAVAGGVARRDRPAPGRAGAGGPLRVLQVGLKASGARHRSGLGWGSRGCVGAGGLIPV
jgi:hypothetical protein